MNRSFESSEPSAAVVISAVDFYDAETRTVLPLSQHLRDGLAKELL